MRSNYERLILENLGRVYGNPENMERLLPALRRGNQFLFRAFGEDCRMDPEGVTFSERPDTGPRALLVSLYAAHARPDPVRLVPFQAFKDLPGSMPYHGAFTMNSERVLAPHVSRIREKANLIRKAFDGQRDFQGEAGDFSLLLYPLPKIGLCCIFYMADEEFPPSATCLFSANAISFMPLDGLADVAEYTAREMIRLIQ